ncbi:hypothetical protein J3U99_19430 [Brucella pituitosa]|uniref:hypothetical protein n=1 Tax=Brucella pituitosa TaxID=571256 RepID=UPI002002B1F5|nr:hypothetical protein [Brucella pituitosa]MCK4206950.1 hypothetical protein [Brucella pituitosa]
MATMQVSICWQSQSGNKTKYNRDCAGIGIADHSLLAVVADGSSTGKESGVLAQFLVHNLVDWFVETNGVVGERELSGQLQQIHDSVAGKFQRSSARYMIVILRPQYPCLVVHAGDCILGRFIDDSITWLTAPDTLANARSYIPVEELAKARSRHLLTRSFRSREFMPRPLPSRPLITNPIDFLSLPMAFGPSYLPKIN